MTQKKGSKGWGTGGWSAVRAPKINPKKERWVGFNPGPPNPAHQQVVVKSRYGGMGKNRTGARGHVRYLAREGRDHDAQEIRSFDRSGPQIDAVAVVDLWAQQGDVRHFAQIYSFESAPRNIEETMRKTMETVERELYIKLEWIGFAHRDTDHQHAHIMIRGKMKDGRHIRIDRDYMKNGFRGAAGEVFTHERGFRTEREILKALEGAAVVRALRARGKDLVVEAFSADLLSEKKARSLDKVMQVGHPAVVKRETARIEEAFFARNKSRSVSRERSNGQQQREAS